MLDKLKSLSSAETSIYAKLCLVVVCILSFRASIDYFGLWGYMIAFALGALWMLTTMLGIAGVYSYMHLDEWLGENTFKDIQYTLPARLIQEKLKLRRVPSIIAQGKRDESKEVEMRGRIVVQLEGAAEDAQKGLCELKGETLFCHNLNGHPKVQAVVIGGSYLRVVNETTLELIHPWKSIWHKEDYIYIKTSSAKKRMTWQNALLLSACKRYSEIYTDPSHYEGANPTVKLYNKLIKEYEAAVRDNPKVGYSADFVLNGMFHRFFIIILSSASIKKALVLKLMEKISQKLELIAEAGKPDRLRELSITEFDLGTSIPVLSNSRLVPSDNPYNSNKENVDLTLRTLLSYKDGDAKIGVKVFIKHNVPLLPQTFNITARLKDLVLDLKIVCGAHPIKRMEISIVDKPIIDFDPMDGGDLTKLRKIPGWEKWGKEKVRNMINDALRGKLCDLLQDPERQYVAMPGVDSDEEYDEIEEPDDPLETFIKKMLEEEAIAKTTPKTPKVPVVGPKLTTCSMTTGTNPVRKCESEFIHMAKGNSLSDGSESESSTPVRRSVVPSAMGRSPTLQNNSAVLPQGILATQAGIVSPRGLPRQRYDRNTASEGAAVAASEEGGTHDPVAASCPANAGPTGTPTGRRRGMSRTVSMTGLTKLSDGDTIGAASYSKAFAGDVITSNQTNKRAERAVNNSLGSSLEIVATSREDESIEDKKKEKKRSGFLGFGKRKDDAEKKRGSMSDSEDLRLKGTRSEGQLVSKNISSEILELKTAASEKPTKSSFPFRSRSSMKLEVQATDVTSSMESKIVNVSLLTKSEEDHQSYASEDDHILSAKLVKSEEERPHFAQFIAEPTKKTAISADNSPNNTHKSLTRAKTAANFKHKITDPTEKTEASRKKTSRAPDLEKILDEAEESEKQTEYRKESSSRRERKDKDEKSKDESDKDKDIFTKSEDGNKLKRDRSKGDILGSEKDKHKKERSKEDEKGKKDAPLSVDSSKRHSKVISPSSKRRSKTAEDLKIEGPSEYEREKRRTKEDSIEKSEDKERRERRKTSSKKREGEEGFTESKKADEKAREEKSEKSYEKSEKSYEKSEKNSSKSRKSKSDLSLSENEVSAEDKTSSRRRRKTEAIAEANERQGK